MMYCGGAATSDELEYDARQLQKFCVQKKFCAQK
jgi:hypothetical protein